ncbi:unnamed protein product [Amoebophrya sp. A120]|nr:unnamed protein product [Amoebophrya sp. A120]|eukprot:GSA120T00016401001.1
MSKKFHDKGAFRSGLGSKAGGFIAQKFFHPSAHQNQERMWMHQERQLELERQAEEREMRLKEERKLEEIRKSNLLLGQQAAAKTKMTAEEKRNKTGGFKDLFADITARKNVNSMRPEEKQSVLETQKRMKKMREEQERLKQGGLGPSGGAAGSSGKRPLEVNEEEINIHPGDQDDVEPGLLLGEPGDDEAARSFAAAEEGKRELGSLLGGAGSGGASSSSSSRLGAAPQILAPQHQQAASSSSSSSSLLQQNKQPSEILEDMNVPPRPETMINEHDDQHKLQSATTSSSAALLKIQGEQGRENKADLAHDLPSAAPAGTTSSGAAAPTAAASSSATSLLLTERPGTSSVLARDETSGAQQVLEPPSELLLQDEAKNPVEVPKPPEHDETRSTLYNKSIEDKNAQMNKDKEKEKHTTSTLYKEDVFRYGHKSVYGSYYDVATKQWGYNCCKVLGKPKVKCPLNVDEEGTTAGDNKNKPAKKRKVGA